MAYNCNRYEKIGKAVFNVSHISVDFFINTLLSVNSTDEFAAYHIVKNTFYKLFNRQIGLLFYCTDTVSS